LRNKTLLFPTTPLLFGDPERGFPLPKGGTTVVVKNREKTPPKKGSVFPQRPLVPQKPEENRGKPLGETKINPRAQNFPTQNQGPKSTLRSPNLP